ncbi:conserved hypothetical protein [Pseudomonas donghuensis]
MHGVLQSPGGAFGPRAGEHALCIYEVGCLSRLSGLPRGQGRLPTSSFIWTANRADSLCCPRIRKNQFPQSH